MILKSVGAFFGLMREKKNGIQHFLENSDGPTFFHLSILNTEKKKCPFISVALKWS